MNEELRKMLETPYEFPVTKIGETRTVTPAELPIHIIRYYLEFGIRQATADRTAGKNGEEAKESVDKFLTKTAAGELPSGGGSQLSEMDREVRDLADAEIKAMIRQSGRKQSEFDLKALRAEHLDTDGVRERLTKEAEAIIRKRKDAATKVDASILDKLIKPPKK